MAEILFLIASTERLFIFVVTIERIIKIIVYILHFTTFDKNEEITLW